MSCKVLRILSFIPFLNVLCYFIYAVLLWKSNYAHKQKEVFISVVAVALAAFPIYVLYLLLSRMIDPLSVLQTVILYAYFYIGPLAVSQVLLWRMSKWKTKK